MTIQNLIDEIIELENKIKNDITMSTIAKQNDSDCDTVMEYERRCDEHTDLQNCLMRQLACKVVESVTGQKIE